MEITSMSNRELYKTLTGRDYDYPNGAKNEELAESNESLNRDSFEFSDEEFYRKTQNDAKETSANSSKYTNDIDFNDINVFITVKGRALGELIGESGGSIITKEAIAEYYGNMAKRLDTAYAEGKFTEEEYDYLNESIAEQMEHSAKCAEETAAFFKVSHKRSMSPKEVEKQNSMTGEEYRADLKAEISEYVRKYSRIDRESLMKLFNNFRYGENV